MKLKILVDNNTYIDQYYLGEPAVSYYIEDEGTKLLLDTGYSNVFMKNMKAFGIQRDDIQTIVLSHGHDDHTGGLRYWFEEKSRQPVKVIAHPDAFKGKVYDGLKICSPYSEQEIRKRCDLILSRKPVKLNSHLTFLGEIPQSNEFEKRQAIGRQQNGETWEDDHVLDDTALVYQSERGIVIITGCSHSGICNIIEYAKQITGEDKVISVMGGFHLFDVDERVKKTIAYLKQQDMEMLYPCHCTSFAVRAEMAKVLPLKEVGVGLELIW